MEESSYYGFVQENDNQFGVWKKDAFCALSNFKVDIACEIKGNKEGDPLGYIFSVTYRDGTKLG